MTRHMRQLLKAFAGLLSAAICSLSSAEAVFQEPFTPRTHVSIRGDQWWINHKLTYAGTRAEGLLMNVRMVNSVFEDRHIPDLDPDKITERFLARVPDYAAHGVKAFTLCLQGGMPGYEGALNSAFEPDGSLRATYLARVQRVIEACDRQEMVANLGLLLSTTRSGARR